MAVVYTVHSTADTGLVKTPYTKITPSSEVVPESDKNVIDCFTPEIPRGFLH